MDFSLANKGKILSDPDDFKAVLKEQHLRPTVSDKDKNEYTVI